MANIGNIIGAVRKSKAGRIYKTASGLGFFKMLFIAGLLQYFSPALQKAWNTGNLSPVGKAIAEYFTTVFDNIGIGALQIATADKLLGFQLTGSWIAQNSIVNGFLMMAGAIGTLYYTYLLFKKYMRFKEPDLSASTILQLYLIIVTALILGYQQQDAFEGLRTLYSNRTAVINNTQSVVGTAGNVTNSVREFGVNSTLEMPKNLSIEKLAKTKIG